MDTSSFACFIVTFRRPEALATTLAALKKQTCTPKTILVIDNGRDEQTREVVNEFADPRVEYMPMPENLGPAGAAHRGLKELATRDFAWIYWCDDDDPPPEDTTLQQLLEVAIDYPGQLGAVGAVGARFNSRRGHLERISDSELTGIVHVDTIGGGQQMIVSGDAARCGILPRPELFFGFEELSLHLALKDAGYDVVVPGQMLHGMRQRAGHLGWTKNARRGRLQPVQSLWREYYSTRNMFYLLYHCTGHRLGAANFALRRLAKAVVGFRRGPTYGFRHAQSILGGLRDGLFRKMGCRVAPPTPNSRGKGSAETTNPVA